MKCRQYGPRILYSSLIGYYCLSRDHGPQMGGGQRKSFHMARADCLLTELTIYPKRRHLVHTYVYSVMSDSATSSTVAHQAPLSWDVPTKNTKRAAVLFSRSSQPRGHILEARWERNYMGKFKLFLGQLRIHK